MGFLCQFTKNNFSLLSIVLIHFLLFPQTNPRLNNNNIGLTKILGNLIQNQLSHRPLLIIQDEQYPSSQVEELLKEISTSHQFETRLLYLHLHTNSPQNSSKSTPKSSKFVQFFEQTSDYRRNKAYCTTVLVFLSEQKDTLDHLGVEMYKVLTRLKGLVKKDEDYFLLISQNEAHLDLILKSSPLSSKVKYRLGIYSNPYDLLKAKVKYSCFYCNSGLPSIFDLDITENLDTLGNLLLQNQMKNLLGAYLRVSTPLSTRWLNEISTDPQGNLIAKRGPYKLVLDLLESHLNFSSSLFPSTGGGTGAILNGSWVGTVGDVLYERAELGHVTAVTWHRHSVVGHSCPISYEWLTFSSGVPQPFFTWRAIYRPLAKEVWYFVFGSVVVGVIFFYFLFLVTISTKNDQNSANSLGWTIHRKIFGSLNNYVLSTLLEQDPPTPETRLKSLFPSLKSLISLRIFTIFWLLYCLLIATAYRSKLVTFLAFPNTEQPPDSFDSLANSDYSILLQYIKGAAYQVFKNSKNPTYTKIFKRMLLEEDDVKCFLTTVKSRSACVSWDSIAEFVKHRNLTDKYGRSPVLKSDAVTLSINAGIVMEKRAIFMREIDHNLRWIMNTGLMQKLRMLDFQFIREQRSEWLRESGGSRPDYEGGEEGDVDALTLPHFSGSFYIWLCGVGLSVVGLFIENILYKRTHYRDDIDKFNL